MNIVILNYRDPLGIARTVVESEEQFRCRCDEAGIATSGVDNETLSETLRNHIGEGHPNADLDIQVEESEYNRFSHAVFAREAEEAGLEVYRYRGRFRYDGPAVNADSVDDVTRHVTVRCQSDNMGMGVVVYPR